MAKQPWFPWYPDDWLSDEKLRACSPGARGLWTDMLCLMHKSDRRGFLQVGGQPVTAEQLARMTGCSTDEVAHLLAELRHAGVFSVSDKNVMYSRRMVRDEQTRQARSQAGQASGRKRMAKTPSANVPKMEDEQNSNKTRTKPEPHISESEPEKKEKNPPKKPPAGAGQKELFEEPETSKDPPGTLPGDGLNPDPPSEADFPSLRLLAPPTPAELMARWNEAAAASGWAPCCRMEERRMQSFRARCKDSHWCEHWWKAIQAAIPLRYLRGENRYQWVANIDWFLRPRSVARLLEGYYQDRQPGRFGRPSVEDAIDRIAKEAGNGA